jgi:RNA polymerase sigma-70 factor (ECF subfamily)
MALVLPFRRRADKPADLSDEALVAACAIGDGAALGTLFDRFHHALYRFLARSATAQREELDDLVQKTFIEVHRSAHRFRGDSSVRAWIFGIAVNVSRHHVRSAARRRATLTLLEKVGPATVAQRPDDIAERQELLERVLRELPALPHDLREAFVLCEVEEMSGVEAARALGIREGTLRRRLHDARVKLRRRLQGGTDGDR